MSIVLALAASLMWGVADYRGGLASRRHPLPAVLAFSQLAGLLGLLVIVAVRGLDYTPAALAEGVAAGLLGAVAVTAFYRSLAIGTMSIAAPVLSTSAAIPVVAGLATGDRPSLLQLAGIALALGGVVLSSAERSGDHETTAAQRLSFLLAVVAMLAIGVQLVLLSAAAETDPLLGATATRGTSVVIFAAVALVLRPVVAPTALPDLALIGILDAFANLAYSAATTGGFLSVVAVLSTLYPVVTVALAHRHLGERLAGPQRVGVALALLGVAAISAG
jgi:drug/metabolite transporter (DMT)-like permease